VYLYLAFEVRAEYRVRIITHLGNDVGFHAFLVEVMRTCRQQLYPIALVVAHADLAVNRIIIKLFMRETNIVNNIKSHLSHLVFIKKL
jgi:hypothetical protein